MRRCAVLTGHLTATPVTSRAALVCATSAAEETKATRDYEQAEANLYPSHVISLIHADAKAAPDAYKDSKVKITKTRVHSIQQLSDWIPEEQLKRYPNCYRKTRWDNRCDTKDLFVPGYNQIIQDDHVVLVDIVRKTTAKETAFAFMRAGPRAEIVWAPGEVKAAVVTCGGLCSGLNDVISELFDTLYYNYGVETIYGIKSGFRGFWSPEYAPWTALTPKGVAGIHEIGGTVLGSSRGGGDVPKIVDNCIAKGVNQIYVIGGDGSHRGAAAICAEVKKRGLKISVVGVPKTIDNDIGVIDRSFGFHTAVAESKKAIQSAVIEASCTPNGIGIVKLMGRTAGYIAAHATMASRQADLCLIPEVHFPMDGPEGVLAFVEKVVKLRGFAVLVVAEGAGADVMPPTGLFDESGNPTLPDVGVFLSKSLTRHFRAKKMAVNIKYHDPSYMIRSVPASAEDSIYAMSLAQNAVHGAMAGYTGFTSGLVNSRTVMIPFSVVSTTSPSHLNPDGRTWERVLSLTHQPNWRLRSKAAAVRTHAEPAVAAKASAHAHASCPPPVPATQS